MNALRFGASRLAPAAARTANASLRRQVVLSKFYCELIEFVFLRFRFEKDEHSKRVGFSSDESHGGWPIAHLVQTLRNRNVALLSVHSSANSPAWLFVHLL